MYSRKIVCMCKLLLNLWFIILQIFIFTLFIYRKIVIRFLNFEFLFPVENFIVISLVTHHSISFLVKYFSLYVVI